MNFDSYTTFEQVKSRMDAILDAVGSPDLPLDEALDLYEEAVGLGLRASDLLEERPEDAVADEPAGAEDAEDAASGNPAAAEAPAVAGSPAAGTPGAPGAPAAPTPAPVAAQPAADAAAPTADLVASEAQRVGDTGEKPVSSRSMEGNVSV